jgi:hemolysin activation/secretion protein
MQLLPLTDGIAGNEVTLADLERAADRITHFYRTNGFSSGARPTFLLRVSTAAASRSPCWKDDTASSTYAITRGSPIGWWRIHCARRIRTRVIETSPLDHDLLVLKDLSGISVAATLTPGERVGTAISSSMSLRHRHTAARSKATTTATGTPANRATAAAWRPANLAGRGDLLSVRGLISQDSGLWYGRAAYQIPVTGGGLSVGGALSHTYYSLGERFDALDADGDANIYTAFAQYPLVRSVRGSLDVQTAYNYFDLEDNVNSTNSVNPRRLQSATLSVSGSLRDDWFGGAINAASIAYGHGELHLQNSLAAQIDDATAQSEGSFDTAMYSLLRLQNVTGALQLYLGFQGQYASKNLDSSQKFVIGGPTAVRAYDQGVGVGDEGLLGTAELRYSLPTYRWFTRPQIVAFFDGGSVRVNVDRFLPTQNRIELYGAGVGVNVDIPYGFALHGSVGVADRLRCGHRRVELRRARVDPARQVVLVRSRPQRARWTRRRTQGPAAIRMTPEARGAIGSLSATVLYRAFPSNTCVVSRPKRGVVRVGKPRAPV